MFSSILIAVTIALSTFYTVAAFGPFGIFRIQQMVPSHTVAALNAYNTAANDYLQKQQAGTLEAGAVAPTPPAPIQPSLWGGIDRTNLMRAFATSFIAAIIGTYGVMAIAAAFRMPQVSWRIPFKGKIPKWEPHTESANGVADYPARERVEARVR